MSRRSVRQNEVEKSTNTKCLFSLREIYAYRDENKNAISEDGILESGDLTLLIGPPDVGKSRLIHQLILSICCGKDKWLDTFRLSKKDIRILVIQTENSQSRIQADLKMQLRCVDQSFSKKLAENVQVYIPQKPEDRDLMLNNKCTVNRLAGYVRKFKPDLIIFDPYRDFIAGENENDSMVARKTIRAMMSIAQADNPKVAVLAVHHSLTGKDAAASAVGYNASGYGRGSKSVMSMARCQINCIPLDDDIGSGIVIAPGKLNNAKKFDTFAVRLDENSMWYELDPDFEVTDWLSSLKRRGRSMTKTKVTWNKVESLLKNEESITRSKLADKIRAQCSCGKTAAYDAIKIFLDEGLLEKSRKGEILITSEK